MILVDTAVWIDFFAGREYPEVVELARLIEDGTEILIMGVVIQDIFHSTLLKISPLCVRFFKMSPGLTCLGSVTKSPFASVVME